MGIKRIHELTGVLVEGDYGMHRDRFLEMARARYRDGFPLLESVRKVTSDNRSNGPCYEVKLSEGLILLIQYLNSEFEGKSPDLRDAIFRRILDDLLSNAKSV